MRKSRFTTEQIIGFIKQVEAGMAVVDLSHQHGFSSATFYQWRAKYGGMEAAGIAFEGVAEALAVPRTDIRLFGKPEAFVKRRMGVVVANGADTDEARERAKLAAGKVRPVRGECSPRE